MGTCLFIQFNLQGCSCKLKQLLVEPCSATHKSEVVKSQVCRRTGKQKPLLVACIAARHANQQQRLQQSYAAEQPVTSKDKTTGDKNQS